MWYEQHARQLPWRANIDPYSVWVSEVMLQQTRVDTVMPYYARWLKRFPSIRALAEASQQDVLVVWEGLGYYGRARNLHKAAQLVMREYGGRLPDDIRSLRRLPGVGRYTAAAIASIAFNRDEPTLDGNIRRVLARCFNVTEPARSTVGERILWSLAAANLPAGRAGKYNQALMDLGALICTPRDPACEQCPLDQACQARVLGVQELRPVVLPKASIPLHIVTAAVIYRDNRVLIACRPSHGLLGGLWEFPGGKQMVGEDLPTCLRREICEELGAEIAVSVQLGVYHHAYTHFKVRLHAFYCSLIEGEPRPIQVADLKWVSPNELAEYPMGKIDRQIAKTLVSSTPL